MVSKANIVSFEFERGKVHCSLPILLNRIILTNNQKEKKIEGNYYDDLDRARKMEFMCSMLD